MGTSAGEVEGAGPGSVQSCRSYSSNTSRAPSWLQATLADLDENMKTLALNLQEEDESDTFAERAENYYRKRPQLLNLLQDLYNGYLCLADRYCQALIKHSHNQSSISTVHSEIDDDEGFHQEDHHHHHHRSESDAESCLSYQQLPPPPNQTPLDSDNLVAQLVIKTVDCEILHHELGILNQCSIESSRKMELQKSLLEVLESERLILLNENARLGYRVTSLAEENKGLASESLLMKRKASELARCVLKMRENHRVCMLSRKIEDLQGQIYGLEKRNKEYYEQLVTKEEKERKKRESGALEAVCFEVEKKVVEMEEIQKVVKEEAMVRKVKDGWRVSSSRWWDRVKNIDLFSTCGGPISNHKSASC